MFIFFLSRTWTHIFTSARRFVHDTMLRFTWSAASAFLFFVSFSDAAASFGFWVLFSRGSDRLNHWLAVLSIDLFLYKYMYVPLTVLGGLGHGNTFLCCYSLKESRAGLSGKQTVRCYNVVTSTCERLCNHAENFNSRPSPPDPWLRTAQRTAWAV